MPVSPTMPPLSFFDQQERARRHTGRLVVLFVISVALTIPAIYAAVLPIAWGAMLKRDARFAVSHEFTWWQPGLFGAIAAGTLAVIAAGTLYKIAELRGGGSVVAARLGATLVPRDTTNADHRRLLNIVEELSIASGVPVPDVFILDDERGINAFAAGWSTADAAVCVTRGCLDRLTREELQGVLGHEFSHILNGDMRLNLRLIGVLNGILLIGLIGLGVLRALGSGRVRTSSRNSGGALLVGLLLGAVLAVVGYIGVFFGRLIKAGVSREREYLADASSVQFTRNPDGLAGALAKIANHDARAWVHADHAEEASHMFFADALPGMSLFASLLATHPPILERIRRIDPAFDLSKIEPVGDDAESGPLPEPTRRALVPSGDAAATMLAASAVVKTLGAPTAKHLAQSLRLLEAMPTPIRAAVREPLSAVALTLCLLLDDDEAMRQEQIAALAAQAPEPICREVQRLHSLVADIDVSLRLPLVDLASGALRRLSTTQVRQFRSLVTLLVESDGGVTLFEYAVRSILLRRLPDDNGRWLPPVARFNSIGKLIPDYVLLLSLLSGLDDADETAARQAFESGLSRLPHPRDDPQIALKERGECSLAAIEESLDRMASSTPAVKELIIDACAHCVLADRQVTRGEGEVLRAVAASLDCPMPPFLLAEPSATASA